jgi:hypothetical protein
VVKLGRDLHNRQRRRLGNQRGKLRTERSGIIDRGPDLAAIAGGENGGLGQPGLAAAAEQAKLIDFGALQTIAQQVRRPFVIRAHDQECLRAYPKRLYL